MSITYPLSIPSSPKPSTISFSSSSVVGISKSIFTGEQQVQAYRGNWFNCSINLPPMSNKQAGAWIAFVMSLNGIEGTFYLSPIVKNNAKPVSGGLVKGSNQNSRVLISDGFPSNKLLFKARDFFSIGNQLLMAVTDTYSNASGEASIDVFPNLRLPADNTSIETINPVGLFRLSNNENTFSIEEASMFGLSIECMEAF